MSGSSDVQTPLQARDTWETTPYRSVHGRLYVVRGRGGTLCDSCSRLPQIPSISSAGRPSRCPADVRWSRLGARVRRSNKAACCRGMEMWACRSRETYARYSRSDRPWPKRALRNRPRSVSCSATGVAKSPSMRGVVILRWPRGWGRAFCTTCIVKLTSVF